MREEEGKNAASVVNQVACFGHRHLVGAGLRNLSGCSFKFRRLGCLLPLVIVSRSLLQTLISLWW